LSEKTAAEAKPIEETSETEISELPEIIEEEKGPLSYADLRRFFFLVVSFGVLALLVGQLAKILILFAVVFFVAMVLNMPVAWLMRKGLNRTLSVVLVLLATLSLVGGLVALIVPPMLAQSNELIAKAPDYAHSIELQLEGLVQHYPALDGMIPNTREMLEQLRTHVQPSDAAGFIWLSTRTIVAKLFLFLIGVLLTVFILMNPQPLVAGLLTAVPVRHREASRRSIARIMLQMAVWMRATLIMGLITGVSTGVLLHLVGVRPALLFGTLAFFGELVPNIGPVTMALPALFVAAGEGPSTFLYALAAILFVQQIESNILVPYVMGSQMQLHPLSIIFFALTMGVLFGVAGAILAVPTAATIKILYDEFYLRPRRVPLVQIEKQAGELVAERAPVVD